jgi:hypothetical protein
MDKKKLLDDLDIFTGAFIWFGAAAFLIVLFLYLVFR